MGNQELTVAAQKQSGVARASGFFQEHRQKPGILWEILVPWFLTSATNSKLKTQHICRPYQGIYINALLPSSTLFLPARLPSLRGHFQSLPSSHLGIGSALRKARRSPKLGPSVSEKERELPQRNGSCVGIEESECLLHLSRGMSFVGITTELFPVWVPTTGSAVGRGGGPQPGEARLPPQPCPGLAVKFPRSSQASSFTPPYKRKTRLPDLRRLQTPHSDLPPACYRGPCCCPWKESFQTKSLLPRPRLFLV